MSDKPALLPNLKRYDVEWHEGCLQEYPGGDLVYWEDLARLVSDTQAVAYRVKDGTQKWTTWCDMPISPAMQAGIDNFGWVVEYAYPTPPASDTQADIRLFDSQWMNCVNHDNCYHYHEWDRQEAIEKAVNLAEKYMKENIIKGWPKPRDTPPASDTLALVWQTIDSAPKDELISIWIPSVSPSGERWMGGDEGECWNYCYWDHICKEWRTSRPSGHLRSVPERFVTHWIPLPKPPANALAGEHGDD